MKKLALMLVVLMVLGGALFAEVVGGPDPITVSGSVETTVGYDLQNSIWGMDGSSDINVQFSLISGGDGAGGEDELYGEITLSAVALNWDETDLWQDDDFDGTDYKGDISAKIVAGNIYVGLNAAGFNANNAVGTETYDVNADDDWLALGGDGSLAIGYDDGSMSFGLEFAPKGGITRAYGGVVEVPFANWYTGYTASEDAVAIDQNTDGEFVLGADASIVAGPLTLPINFVLDPQYGPEGAEVQLMIAGAAPNLVSGPITVDIPLDFIKMGTSSGFDLGPAVSMELNDDGSSFGLTAYYYSCDGSGVDVSYAKAGVTVTEVQSGGFVDGIGADLAVDITDLVGTGTLGWAVSLGLDISLGDGINLYIDPSYGSDSIFELGAGVTLAAEATGIDNTAITLDYGCFASDGDITDGDSSDTGIIKATVSIAF